MPMIRLVDASLEPLRNGRHHDVCLIDALRAHRFKVPYCEDGPFYAVQDGSKFLRPSKQLRPHVKKPIISFNSIAFSDRFL